MARKLKIMENEKHPLDNHIGQIRKKLDWKDVLISIPKIGYKLKREK